MAHISHKIFIFFFKNMFDLIQPYDTKVFFAEGKKPLFGMTQY